MTILSARTFGIAVTSVWLALAATSSASAQSYYYPPTPSQGPPPNQSDSSQAFTIDTFITRHCCDETTGAKDGLYDQIEQAIAENNAAYGVASTGAVVTARTASPILSRARPASRSTSTSPARAGIPGIRAKAS